MVGAIDNLPKDIIKEDLSVEACVLRCVLGNGMFKFDGASAGALLLYCQYAGARDGSVAFLVIEAVANDIAPHFLNITKVMIDGFYSQNGRGPKPKCSR